MQDRRSTALALAARHGLDAAGSQRLLALATPPGPDDAALQRMWRGVAAGAAALAGLGVLLWVAANWADFGRTGRFAILQALVLLPLLGAAARPALRAPLALMAFLATGALFAYFGQTYQTGADPWQLFALWALLGLPLCLAVRGDLLWLPWAVVVVTAISLWVQAHTGHRWRVLSQDLAVHGAGWAGALLLVGLLGRGLARVTGAGVWSRRMAATLFVGMLGVTALGGLFGREIAPHYLAALVLLALWACWLCTPRGFDIFGLSAAALALDTLLLCGLARLLFQHMDDDMLGPLLLLGLAAAGMLAGSVHGILRVARRRENTP